MITDDPVPQVIELGYTPREAVFLSLVGQFSGFFLGRQFSEFAMRERGGILKRFISDAQRREHLEVLRYGPRGHVYHLKSKFIYRVLGYEDSQNRRLKGDDEIKTRLMILDYALQNDTRMLLSSAQEKIEFFRDRFGISTADLPSTVYVNTRAPGGPAERYFADRFPISVTSNESRIEKVEFTYFDNGYSTIKPFRRFLTEYKSLLIALGTFHLVYIAGSKRNFSIAGEFFERTFAQTEDGCRSDLLPFGAEHLLRFFQSRQRWDNSSPEFSPEDLRYLKEGEKSYRRPEHDSLHFAWTKGRFAFERQLKLLGLQKQLSASFQTHLLARTYPVFGCHLEQNSVWPVPSVVPPVVP